MGELMRQFYIEDYADTQEAAIALLPGLRQRLTERLNAEGLQPGQQMPPPTPTPLKGVLVSYCDGLRQIVHYRLAPAPGDVFVARVDVLAEPLPSGPYLWAS